jgi:glucosamine--fructose-6-phosphate aminotransferase (isomerizing)
MDPDAQDPITTTPAPASLLEREMREQGEVLAARTSSGWEAAERASEVLGRDDVDYLVIAARGSSDNAARYAQYLLGLEARLPVALATPWLYGGGAPPRLEHGAVLAISQSGRSPDIVGVLRAAAGQGRPTVALTNDPGSPLAEPADVVVPMLAGEERSVAATKTYLATLHAVAQIVASLRPTRERDSWFTRLPDLVSSLVEQQLHDRDGFDRLASATLLTAVGRGLELSTACETALKVRELSGLPAEAFSMPDLIHGPIAALHPSGALWLISTAGRDQPAEEALEVLGGATGLSVAVSDRAEVAGCADIGVRIPEVPEWLAPLLAVIPGQAAALRLGELQKVDLDRPHGLSKITLTR